MFVCASRFRLSLGSRHHRSVWWLHLHVFVFSERVSCHRDVQCRRLSVVFRQLLEGFLRCSASRRALCAYTTPSSVLCRCSSVRSLLPTRPISTCQPASAWDFQILVPPLEDENRFTKLQHFPQYGPPNVRWDGDCASFSLKRGMSEVACRTIHSSAHSHQSVCIACGLAMLPTLCAFVPATASDNFPLLR